MFCLLGVGVVAAVILLTKLAVNGGSLTDDSSRRLLEDRSSVNDESWLEWLESKSVSAGSEWLSGFSAMFVDVDGDPFQPQQLGFPAELR